MATKKKVIRVKSPMELEVLAAKKDYEKIVNVQSIAQVFPVYEMYKSLSDLFDFTRDGIEVIRENGHLLLDEKKYDDAIAVFQRAKQLARILDMKVYATAKEALYEATGTGDEKLIAEARASLFLTQVARDALRSRAEDLQGKAAYANGNLDSIHDEAEKAEAVLAAKELTDNAVALSMRVLALDTEAKELEERAISRKPLAA